MAKNTQPVLKRCKTLGLSPAVLGYSKSTDRSHLAIALLHSHIQCIALWYFLLHEILFLP